MFEFFSWTFVVFTSMIGIVQIIFWGYEKLFDDKSDKNAVVVLPLSGHKDNIEYIIRTILTKTNTSVFVIDMGIDDETREICNILSKTSSMIKVVDKNEFIKLVSDEAFMRS